MSKRTAIIISAAGAVMALALILLTVTTTALHSTVTQLQHQTVTQAAQISSQADRIKGTHPDPVTCGDPHSMGLQYAYGAAVDSSGYLSVDQAPVPLLSPCING